MGLIGANNDEKVWNYLYSVIKNPYGVSGLMGNLYAESGLRPDNLQNSYEKILGLTDKEYVLKVDNGTYGNFINDHAGFGLAQWTFWSRKLNLLDYVKSMHSSIGDLEIQLEFLIYEIRHYSEVWKILTTTNSVKEASDIVLTKYEQPADQSDNVKDMRYTYSINYFNQFFPTLDKGFKYTVQRGDTLWGLATRFLGSGYRYIDIMELNELDSTIIEIGQILIIPTE